MGAEYGMHYNNEIFTIDKLGNRAEVNDKSGVDVTYSVDNVSNRYNAVASASLAYDNAGNLTVDEQGYQYEYDYENRIVKIKDSGSNTVAQYDYDALGRRIRKIVCADTMLYYLASVGGCMKRS